jgi:hypothetical protein
VSPDGKRVFVVTANRRGELVRYDQKAEGTRRLSGLPGAWKDADPDIPILKEAKAEYAKLK